MTAPRFRHSQHDAERELRLFFTDPTRLRLEDVKAIEEAILCLDGKDAYVLLCCHSPDPTEWKAEDRYVLKQSFGQFWAFVHLTPSLEKEWNPKATAIELAHGIAKRDPDATSIATSLLREARELYMSSRDRYESKRREQLGLDR